MSRPCITGPPWNVPPRMMLRVRPEAVRAGPAATPGKDSAGRSPVAKELPQRAASAASARPSPTARLHRIVGSFRITGRRRAPQIHVVTTKAAPVTKMATSHLLADRITPPASRVSCAHERVHRRPRIPMKSPPGHPCSNPGGGWMSVQSYGESPQSSRAPAPVLPLHLHAGAGLINGLYRRSVPVRQWRWQREGGPARRQLFRLDRLDDARS